MRDHRRLQAFLLADALTLDLYRETQGFPKAEQYGLTIQMRRAAVSIAANIVEGCARPSQADYLRFLDMAYGSAKELEYLVSLAQRLDYLQPEPGVKLSESCVATARTLNALITALRTPKPKA